MLLLKLPQLYLVGVSGVYAIRNTASRQVYVGSSSNIGKRLRSHRAQLNRGVHRNRALQADWQHGAANFVVEVLETGIAPADLLIREAQWIDDKQANVQGSGYNVRLRADSNLGLRHTQEARAKIAEAGLGRPGYTRTAKHRRATAQRLKGNKLRLGQAHTQDARARMSSAHAGRSQPHKSPLTADQVRELRARHAAGESGYSLARAFGLSQSGVSSIVRRKTWRHLE